MITMFVTSGAVARADGPPPADAVEVLTRGPVHEAFAQPVIFDDEVGFTTTVTIPAPIEEIIPDEKPEGNHIVWIPGYWSWDTDRNDFIWVSGCWRAVPPNTSWISGYWAKSQEGYRWVAGFWTTADTEEIEYLPTPPATLEAGPQGAGTPDSIWIPGCWVRYQDRYAWRRGFWELGRANWVWVPAQYLSTPRGCIYVEGYWDYPLEQRGVMFLPMYCSPLRYGRADFRYSPEFVLSLDVLTLNLFSVRQRHHYYFGDYYGTEYAQEYRPWYEVREHHDGYDPLFVHQQWQHRHDHRWLEQLHAGYDQRRENKAPRPARTYATLQAQIAGLPKKDRKQAQMALPLKEIISAKTTPFKFEVVNAKTREAAASQAKEVHVYKISRSQWESSTTAPTTAKDGATPKVDATPKEPARTPSKELPKPETGVAPLEKPRIPNRDTVEIQRPTGQAVPSQKVKIPKSPIVVREPARNKELTPPPKPQHPDPMPAIRPIPTKDVPERAKEQESADKQKPEPSKK